MKSEAGAAWNVVATVDAVSNGDISIKKRYPLWVGKLLMRQFMYVSTTPQLQ